MKVNGVKGELLSLEIRFYPVGSDYPLRDRLAPIERPMRTTLLNCNNDVDSVCLRLGYELRYDLFPP